MKPLAKAYDKPDFTINDLEDRGPQQNVLLTIPDYFDVIDVKNVYMEGSIIDRRLAKRQWQQLRDTYEALYKRGLIRGLFVEPGAEGLEDMVFCCNPIYSWVVDDTRCVVLSHMRYPSRQREVEHHRLFCERQGFKIIELEGKGLFEGGGDAIPHPYKRLIWGGYGHRSDRFMYDEISAKLKTPIICLELVSPYFYHLDTCFSPLDDDTVLICPEAFSKEGLEVIHQMYKKVYDIPMADVKETFSLNFDAVFDESGEKKVAVIQKSNSIVIDILQKEGYEVIQIETGEYMKSGGSVFCMKTVMD